MSYKLVKNILFVAYKMYCNSKEVLPNDVFHRNCFKNKLRIVFYY